MRTLLFILGMAITVIATSQVKTKTANVNVNRLNGEPQTVVDGLTFSIADTVSATDSTYSVVIPTFFNRAFTYNVKASLDTVSSPIGARAILRGKVWNDDTYTPIDTVTYKGTADTTFTFSSSTAVRYQYMDVLFEQDSAGILRIRNVKAKFWY